MNILYAPFAARLPNKAASPKNYPFALALAVMLTATGHDVLQVGSNQEMSVTANMERNRSFQEVGEMLQECDTFIGVDSYLQHHAWFVNKRGIVLWGPSDPKHFGHDLHVNLYPNPPKFRPRQFEAWTQWEADPEAFVKPEVVMSALQRLHQPT